MGRPDAYAGELPVAFVTLVPDGRVTADELMAYAGEQISERAAVPKAISILPELPLTAVGKIFKPELRRRATRAILEEELAPLGDDGAEIAVEVGPHERHGTIAKVTISGPDAIEAAENAKKILGAYSVAFEVDTA